LQSVRECLPFTARRFDRHAAAHHGGWLHHIQDA
jgi:hypothetical protein